MAFIFYPKSGQAVGPNKAAIVASEPGYPHTRELQDTNATFALNDAVIIEMNPKCNWFSLIVENNMVAGVLTIEASNDSFANCSQNNGQWVSVGTTIAAAAQAIYAQPYLFQFIRIRVSTVGSSGSFSYQFLEGAGNAQN